MKKKQKITNKNIQKIKNNKYYLRSGILLAPLLLAPFQSAHAIATGCGSPQACPPTTIGNETCKNIWIAGDCACEEVSCNSPSSPPPPPPAPPASYAAGVAGNADSTFFSNNQVNNPFLGQAPTPHNCNPTDVTWSVGGYTCTGGVSGCSDDSSGSVGSSAACPIPAGSTVSVKDVNGRGVISYTCESGNGSLVALSSPTPTCTPIQYCPSTSVSWTVGSYACSGVVPELEGNTTTDVSTTSGDSGTNNYECVIDPSGKNPPQVLQTPTFTSATCTPRQVTVNVTCPTTTESWTGGCDGSAGPETGTQTVYAPNTGSTTYTLGTYVFGNGTAGYTGSAYFDCTYQVSSTTPNGASITGTFNTTPDTSPASSCNETPNCAAGTINWSVGSASCAASIGTGVANATSTVSSFGGTTTGSDTFKCIVSGDTATWTAQGPASCAASASCPATTLSWTGDVRCSASVAASPNGTVDDASVNNTTKTGSTTFQCENGTWVDTGNDFCETTSRCDVRINGVKPSVNPCP